MNPVHRLVDSLARDSASRLVAGLARRLDCPLVVDEAYVNFADDDCVGLVADL